VLKFAVQGHSIVHEIEHSHLEQAINKANTAAHVVVEATSQRQRFEQHYTRCAAHSADTQACIAHLEQTVLQVAGALEKTLVSASDLLKYRNLITARCLLSSWQRMSAFSSRMLVCPSLRGVLRWRKSSSFSFPSNLTHGWKNYYPYRTTKTIRKLLQMASVHSYPLRNTESSVSAPASPSVTV
jgi:hypothetical protein